MNRTIAAGGDPFDDIPSESGAVGAKVSVQADRMLVLAETQSGVISEYRGEGNACDLSGSREG